MTPRPPKADPPAPNGKGPFTIDAAKLIGQAVAAALAEQLPRALAQMPPRPQFKCLACVTRRAAWVARHQAELQAAQQAMAEVTAAWPPDDPRRHQVNLLMFLPPQFRPSPDPARPNPEACPNIAAADVLAGGNGYCADDAPGIQQADGRKQVLVAHAPLSAALVAEVMGQGA